MTPAEHAALSAQLALAIGYEQINVQTCGDYALVHGLWDDSGRDWQHWRTFDYRDPSVALPVLEWLMREHGAAVPRTADNTRISVVCRLPGEWGVGDTLPEAIARAAIAVADAKRRHLEQNEAREVLQA